MPGNSLCLLKPSHQVNKPLCYKPLHARGTVFRISEPVLVIVEDARQLLYLIAGMRHGCVMTLQRLVSAITAS